MSVFRPLPLGTPIPGSLHSVSCSLPTMADVIGYEERDARVVGAMRAGYPRFAIHPLVQELIRALAAEIAQPGEQLWPVLSARAAAALVAQLGAARARATAHAGVAIVIHATDPHLAQLAKLWLQHTGGLLSSRGAEDALVRLGQRATVAAETTFAGDARAEIERVLLPLFAGASREDLSLAGSGMGAMHAAFRAVTRVQAARGRTAWVQLGWLYLDTIALLKKFTPDPARDHLVLHDVTNFAALEKLFAEHGARIAGVITEAPTNPLLQTGDLAAIKALAHRHGARVIADPAIASPFNVDVLPHADIAAFSLTKYASHEGDVMIGAAVVNPAGPDAEALRASIASELDAPYPRDLARLAAEIRTAPDVVRRINATTPLVVSFLERYPRVERVWWSGQRATAANYAQLARTPESVGAVVSFTLRGSLASFYDRLTLPKGPSFGMATTLICPYVYLAHYDLLPNRSSGAVLREAGLPAELLRLSVGTEPASEIIAALGAALEG
ncbi:MAG: PLP-dependent transferase [Opitutae bacterium]|nr:PLP-dependent transferase [Opitutae bacterium]